MTWWWLSFCDPQRPEGQQLLGVSIVEAESEIEALGAAVMLDCCPVAEVAIVPLVTDPPERYRGRLMEPDEAKIASVLCIGQ